MTQNEEKENRSIAKEIDRIRKLLEDALSKEDYYLPVVMALHLVSANYAIHDEANMEDFLNSARIAWKRVRSSHMRGDSK